MLRVELLRGISPLRLFRVKVKVIIKVPTRKGSCCIFPFLTLRKSLPRVISSRKCCFTFVEQAGARTIVGDGTGGCKLLTRPNSSNNFGVNISYYHEHEVYLLSILSLSFPCMFYPFSHLSSSSLSPNTLSPGDIPALASLMAGADVGVCARTNKALAWETTGSSHLPRLMALGCPLAPSDPAEEPLMLCCLSLRPRRSGAFSPRHFSLDFLLDFVLVRGRVLRSTPSYLSVNV